MLSEKANNYISGREFIRISSLIAFTLAIITLTSNTPISEIVNYGFFIDYTSVWIQNGFLSWSLNLIVIVAISIAITICNNQFQFIRTFTSLLATVFIILTCSNIAVSNNLIGGNIIVLIIIIAVSVLYFTFQRPNSTLLFSVFALLTSCSLYQYSYITLIPIFLLGAFQMQAITLKSLLAIILGVTIPFWILYGLHIVSPSDILSLKMVSIAKSTVDYTPNYIYNLATATITFILLIKNMFTIYNFPPQERAYNGVLTLLTLWSLVMPMIDYSNSTNYTPTLYLCCAIQVAHAYTTSRYKYKYLWIIALMASYISLYIWQML